VPYEPGALKAIARTNGRELSTFTLQTAGAPDRIALVSDAATLRANGEDIAHLEFAIVDAQGVCVPDAAQTIVLEIAGPAELLGFGNADATNTDSARDPTHSAFRGRALAIVRSTDTAGAITIKATAPGLKPAVVKLQSQR
jgi:beta-galactosidase